MSAPGDVTRKLVEDWTLSFLDCPCISSFATVPRSTILDRENVNKNHDPSCFCIVANSLGKTPGVVGNATEETPSQSVLGSADNADRAR